MMFRFTLLDVIILQAEPVIQFSYKLSLKNQNGFRGEFAGSFDVCNPTIFKGKNK